MADDKTARLKRRFYKDAAAAAEGDGFSVRLDGRPVRTPKGNPLTLAAGPLAAAVAEEWSAQGDKIDPGTMPLTQIACTAIDHVQPNRDDIVGQIAKYAETDLLCYRTDAPPDLAERQQASWQPVLDWAAAELGVRLTATEGILPVAQDAAALARARDLVAAMADHRLAAFAVLTQALGSVCLAFAVERGHLDPVGAADRSQLDDIYQSDKWGEDREAVARLRGLRTDIEAAARYLSLLGASA